MSLESSPKISVIVYTYNVGEYVQECIESVLAQTLHPFEIIICDDHSLDGTWEIISEYSNRYPEIFRAYRHKENIGPARNGNFGRRCVRGELYSYIDGDDRWLPNKLELEWRALQTHPDAKIAYSNVYLIDSDGHRVGTWYDNMGPAPPGGDVFVQVYSKRFFPNTHSIFRNPLVYRSLLEEVGYVDESLASYWDWSEKILFTFQSPVAYSGEALVEYRLHEKGISRRGGGINLMGLVQVYEKHLPLLNQRSKKEAVWVKCNVESIIASGQEKIPPTRQLPYYSVHSVYKRNWALFSQLPIRERWALRRDVAPLFTRLTRRAILKVWKDDQCEWESSAQACRFYFASLNPCPAFRYYVRRIYRYLIRRLRRVI